MPARAVAAVGLAVVWLGTCGLVQRPLSPAEARLADHYTNNDPAWGLLAHATVTADPVKGQLRADFDPTLRDLAGKPFRISGYMAPLETGASTRHFIVTRRSSGCPFCPPNSPTEAVEVRTSDPVPVSGQEVKVEGTLVLTASSDQGLFFALNAARLAKPAG